MPVSKADAGAGARLGERLREERTRLGLTQAQVAAASGIANPTQVGYEQGRRVPDLHYLTAIEGLGFDQQYVRTGVRLQKGSVDSFDWNHFADVCKLVADWLKRAGIELDIEPLMEVQRLVYELSIHQNSGLAAAADRVLTLVVSKR